MTLSDSAVFFLGLLLAAWVVGGIWAVSSGLSVRRRAQATLRHSRRLGKMLDEAPALPLLVRTDGRIEGPERLARWFGLDGLPPYFSDLSRGDTGWSEDDLQEVQGHITAAQKTARPFTTKINVKSSRKSLRIKGHQADPQIAPLGAALLWIFDDTESQENIESLQSRLSHAETAFSSLSTLIEAAPMPMWHRDTDGNITLVNSAYVKAVDGADAKQVVADNMELVETVDGLTPAAVAAKARSDERMVERTVATTIDGKRQVMRVVDLPLGEMGVAGYAINVQELESLKNEFGQFRRAQRDMLDNMSAGVAQFDSEKALVFCNQPFQRIFSLRPQWVNNSPEFDRILDRMREAGCVPEVRDFPEWKGQKRAWFTSTEAIEDNWLLPDGTHLRAIAQPTPDGGLLLIFEDRTEQVQLASARDTLLRVRTAMFDSLFEALAVFSPDGRLHLWNRRFMRIWSIEEDSLAEHPRVDELMKMLAPRLQRPAQIAALRDIIRAATLDRNQRNGRIILSDGRCFEFAGIPLPDGNAMLTMLDISDSQQIEQALRERNDALVEADSIKGKFLANMSYEFRTPLTSIGGFAEMLSSGIAGPLPGQAQEYVDAILDSVDRLSGQIENVLDLSQSEAGAMPLVQTDIEVAEFLAELANSREETVEAKHIDLDIQLDPELATLRGDEKRLAQAIGNILDNALEYTQEKGRILIHAAPKDSQTQIVISDNGPGMDMQAVAAILGGIASERDVEDKQHNSGLGLPLAKQLVEAQGGIFDIISRQGEGTVVTLTLP
ncbi:PAS domain-containing sensor histidine kinase [Sphingorhabdus sp. Alg239-R122]|uniref:sensor histidine kinase n=1 Tax=Sphingorhabdus sp. Alg239-R122 TaxID=2305989 RepID=UPI0013DCB416|nr:PAS domain-containing sensor histidine kinase [Sphingorhabdus sp. Alg239-R122]